MCRSAMTHTWQLVGWKPWFLSVVVGFACKENAMDFFTFSSSLEVEDESRKFS